MLKTYDPNIPNDFNAKTTVKVVFMKWGYTLTVEETIESNCVGLELVDSVISNIVENNETIIFKSDDGELEVELYDDWPEDELKNCVVFFEVKKVESKYNEQ